MVGKWGQWSCSDGLDFLPPAAQSIPGRAGRALGAQVQTLRLEAYMPPPRDKPSTKNHTSLQHVHQAVSLSSVESTPVGFARLGKASARLQADSSAFSGRSTKVTLFPMDARVVAAYVFL